MKEERDGLESVYLTGAITFLMGNSAALSGASSGRCKAKTRDNYLSPKDNHLNVACSVFQPTALKSSPHQNLFASRIPWWIASAIIEVDEQIAYYRLLPQAATFAIGAWLSASPRDWWLCCMKLEGAKALSDLIPRGVFLLPSVHLEC